MKTYETINEAIDAARAEGRAQGIRDAAVECDRTANDQSELGDMNGYRATRKARERILALLDQPKTIERVSLADREGYGTNSNPAPEPAAVAVEQAENTYRKLAPYYATAVWTGWPK